MLHLLENSISSPENQLTLFKVPDCSQEIIQLIKQNLHFLLFCTVQRIKYYLLI